MIGMAAGPLPVMAAKGPQREIGDRDAAHALARTHAEASLASCVVPQRSVRAPAAVGAARRPGWTPRAASRVWVQPQRDAPHGWSSTLHCEHARARAPALRFAAPA